MSSRFRPLCLTFVHDRPTTTGLSGASATLAREMPSDGPKSSQNPAARQDVLDLLPGDVGTCIDAKRVCAGELLGPALGRRLIEKWLGLAGGQEWVTFPDWPAVSPVPAG